MSEPIHVLAVPRLSPLWPPQLHAAYTVHDRLHETDPAAFERAQYVHLILSQNT